jgi:YD repeat-containing protein
MDSAHKHAVTHLGGVQKYWYDANGNMTKRIVGADTFDLSYDYENHLTQVKKNGSTLATFVYDGDGKRVKGTVSGVTTAYIGNHFEWTGSTSTMKKYYYAGGARVAMRVGSTLSFLLTDHLGSTAITASSSGAKSAELRYKAWGETRYTSGATPTDFRYTGQRFESLLGLHDYGAAGTTACWDAGFNRTASCRSSRRVCRPGTGSLMPTTTRSGTMIRRGIVLTV